MQDFNLYFTLGLEHILTWDALDHILFVTALCLRYVWRDWKKVVVLVTAFTIGHSVTLVLSALNYISFSVAWIEFLVPVTIALTALNNMFQKTDAPAPGLPAIYFLALFFGLIHGLAYATTILHLEGRESLVARLFAFNLGIEAGQLVVVAVVLLISFILVDAIKASRLWWIRIASLLILAVSLKITFERLPAVLSQNV